MDATCKIQESIHKYLSFYLICPENWVHIKFDSPIFYLNINLFISKIITNITSIKTLVFILLIFPSLCLIINPILQLTLEC